MPENPDIGVKAGDVNSPPTANHDSTGQNQDTSSEGVKGPPPPRYGHWRRGWWHHRHHGPSDINENMPLSSDSDAPIKEMSADEKERYMGYRMWEKYYEHRFPGQNFPRHPEFKGEGDHPTMPDRFDRPSVSSAPMKEMFADEKERYKRYKMWEKYYEHRFPGQTFPRPPEFQGEIDQSTMAGRFDGPFQSDQQFGRPYPHHFYHRGHYHHCGGRFNKPKPTMQERLQREFDFI